MSDEYVIEFKGYELIVTCDEDNDRIILNVEDSEGEVVGGTVINFTDDDNEDYILN